MPRGVARAGILSQFLILTRHFFLRLFLNDVVAFEEQMKERVMGVLALVAILSGLISYALTSPYAIVPDRGTSWVETCVVITFAMLVMGLIAVLEWDILFLDGRDFANLMPLPVRAGVMAAAKIASLVMFTGMFFAALVVFSTGPFLIYIPQWHSESLGYLVRFAGVHLLTMFLACFFAFFANAVLISGLMTILGYGLLRKIYVYVRTVLLVINAAMLFFFIRVLVYGVRELAALAASSGRALQPAAYVPFFPPIWFTDLYETLLGKTDLPFHGSYGRALWGLGLIAAGVLITSWIGYARALARMGAAPPKRRRPRLAPAFETAFNAVFLRNPTERAVFHFYRKTLKASAAHRVRLATFLALGVGCVPLMVAIDKVVPKAGSGINRSILSVPLILVFFFALGLRTTVNVPSSLGSNWVFRITEGPTVRPYFAGLRKAVYALGMGPLVLLCVILSLFLMPPPVAFNHGLFLAAVAVLITEALFLRCNKIPFACSYLPGKEKVQLFWFFYLLVFIIFVQVLSWVELALLMAPRDLPKFLAVAAAAVVAGRLYQRLVFFPKVGIKFEERPEPIVLGLDYETPAHIRS